MTPAETLYRALLRLYPEEHRQAYGKQMQQHARDLELAARERGRLTVAALYLRLIADSLANATSEQIYAFQASGGIITPVPWPGVLMAAIPGIWMALARRHSDLFGPALSIFAAVYFLLLVLGSAVQWRFSGKVSVWALGPICMVVRWLIYWIGINVTESSGLLDFPVSSTAIILLLNLLLVVSIYATMLHGRRLPASALIVAGLMLLSGLLMAYHLGQSSAWSGRFLIERLLGALFVPVEAFMLVALGLVAARKHTVLATLVVLGGFGAMFGDNDYLWGSPYRDWPGLPIYLAGMTFLLLVLTPALLLRARTRSGQALALLIPVTLFLAARTAVPAIVLGQAASFRPGDALISATVLLGLIMGWVLYSHIGDTTHEGQQVST